MQKCKISNGCKGNVLYLNREIKGDRLLLDSQLNKGTAFTHDERTIFGLHGKLPEKIETLDEQIKRVYKQYKAQGTNLQKNIFLNELHSTNQTLFYKLVQEYTKEILPIIYTPTIADAIKEQSNTFTRPKGLYISYPNKDNIEKILSNYSTQNIDLIVVTDGERILGIGDQGINGVQISIAKLMLYSAFGGINPMRTLPIVLDVGTNNEQLLNDELYLGCKHKRIENNEYYDFVDHFVSVVKKLFPGVLLHWEDFGRDNAIRNLKKFQNEICSINDDIQGTAVVTTAAVLSALQKTNQTLSTQRIVVFGAGASGLGISELVCEAMKKEGLSEEECKERFWLIDKQGLLTETSENIIPSHIPYLRKIDEISEWKVNNKSEISLKEVVAHVKPTILMGCSGVSCAFTEDIIVKMAKHVKNPIIFPLSNPSDKIEATPENIIKWTSGKALVATGSPFNSVNFGGQTISISQCNNALVFPGIGLGVLSTQAKLVTQSVLWEATKALLQYFQNIDPAEKDELLLPPMHKAKEISTIIALAVAKKIINDNLTELPQDVNLEDLIRTNTWHPEYLNYIVYDE